MLNHNVTNEVATILYGEQLTLRDSLDEAATVTTHQVVEELTPAYQAVEELVPAYQAVTNAKPLDGRCTLGVVAFPAIEPLAEKWKPP